MADNARNARKAAEKAARDLITGPLIAAAGDLGEAVTAQQDAAAAVTAAHAKAAELVAAAKREGAALVADARAGVDTTDQAYAVAHAAALDAGWAPKALTDLGYPSLAKRTRADRRISTNGSVPQLPTPADDTSRGGDHVVDDAVVGPNVAAQ